jgi:glycosyltransferase involved in cell wall biosynthesis
MPDSRRESTVAGTVVDSERLPAAKVLAGTYLDHHPDHDFVVLVVDGEPEANSAFRIVGPDWLSIGEDEFFRLATRCSADELIRAVTPLLLRQLLDQSDLAVYLAPEIQVYAPFPEITELAASRDIVLAPRSLAPLPRDGFQPSDEEFAFDRGFLAVGQGAKPFLDFWQSAPDRAANWLDLVPGLFRHTSVNAPGFAVAYWNLHERPLATEPDATVNAGGDPLRFFNFSGYRPETPWLLSAHCDVRPRVVLSEDPELRKLCDSHRNKLLAAGYRERAEAEPYRYGQLPDGSAITTQMRKLFAAAWAKLDESDEPPAHPFGADQGAAFRHWLSSPGSPAERTAGMNRLVMAVWTNRTDLQVAFPRPCHQDATGFRQWCRTHGVAEGLLPDWALPAEPAPIRPPVDEFGVNLAGYLTAELGLGELGRIVHSTLRHSGVPVASVVEELSLSCRASLEKPDTVGEARFPVSILSVNADFTQLLLDGHPEVGHRRYRIGLWAWELEEFPPSMREGFGLVDEVWTISDFSRRAIAMDAPVPVKAIPLPVLDPGAVARQLRQPGDTVQFLFAFDFNSTGQRKNPWGLVSAFQRAFPDRDNVRLVIKATNGDLHASAAQRLRYIIGGDQRIDLLERYLSVDELNDLYASSDAYVSLHRSEGFGLTVAEAMIRGMPVISTDYASTTEFLNADVGWPIPYVLTEVGPGWHPYQADAKWADPDLDEAARAMRAVVDDPAEARRRGAAAREHLLRTRSMDAAAEWIRVELENAYQTWRARDATPRRPFARTLRRGVRRAMNRDRPVA